MKYLRLILLGASILSCFSGSLLSAQTMEETRMDSTIKDHKITFFGKSPQVTADSIDRLIRAFYEDQFRHFQDPLAPYFLFMSKDAQLAMGIGGVVRMRGYFDWGGSIPSPGFAPYLIPMQKNPERERYLGSTPAGTALFFRVIGRNKAVGQYQLYIEANFNGYNARDFHLKKAYGQINDWTIGYTNSTFSDPAAEPPTIDASGPNSKMSATAVLLRYCHTFKSGWSVAGSIEQPSDQIDVLSGVTAKVEQYVPDVAAFGQYAWGSNHVRLAGIVRTMPYRDLLTAKNHTLAGWGFQLSGKYSPERRLTIYVMTNGGQGYQGLGGDWLMGKYDLVNDPDKQGRMYAPWAVGGFAGLQVNITPMMFLSATYGATRYLPRHGGEPNEYRTGMYWALNYFWYLTPRMSCGAEFNLGRRENMDRSTAWARRIGLLASFSF